MVPRSEKVESGEVGTDRLASWDSRLILSAAGAAVYGKFVTFGVTRGWIEVDSPVSSITWLIAP